MGPLGGGPKPPVRSRLLRDDRETCAQYSAAVGCAPGSWVLKGAHARRRSASASGAEQLRACLLGGKSGYPVWMPWDGYLNRVASDSLTPHLSTSGSL